MTHGESWRSWILMVLLAAVAALIGIGIDENRRAIADLRTTMYTNSNRITALEQSRDYQQRQLDRIELGVETVKALMQRQNRTP